MSTYSNWREDLIEVIDTPTTEDKAEKKIKETKVNNKVVINPTFKESVAEMGGELLEVAEVDDKKGTSEDPQIKSKEKRAGMIKRQVLLKKLQAVRAGGGTDITAGYEPEGEMVEAVSVAGKVNTAIRNVEREEKLKRINKTLQAMRKQKGDFHPLLHNPKGGATAADLRGEEVVIERLGGKGYSKQAAASSVYPGKKGTGDWEDSDRGAGNKAARRAGKKVEKKSPTYRAHVLNKEEVVDEGIMKMVKKVIRSQKPEKKAEKAMDAGARAKRHLARKVHAKYVSGSEDIVPDDIREGKGYQPEIEHSKLGDAKKKADKERESKLPPHLQGDAIGKMKKAFASEGEDKAFNFVVNKLKAKYGDGVLTKGDKIKPLTPEQKKKNAEIMAKRAKQDGRDATEKASDGRYSDRYSNRGSD